MEQIELYIIAGGSLNTTDGHGALLAIGILIQALSGQAVLLGRNCENAAKMALWLCPVILYGYGNAAKSEPAEIA